jgi:hypothetical protein
VATITCIDHDGATHSVEVAEGDFVMRRALNNDLPSVSGRIFVGRPTRLERAETPSS